MKAKKREEEEKRSKINNDGSPDNSGASHDLVTIFPSDRSSDVTTCLVAECKSKTPLCTILWNPKTQDCCTAIAFHDF
jgi:hypothetical protein